MKKRLNRKSKDQLDSFSQPIAKTRRHIVLISDSTGNMGERIIRALITQFPLSDFTFRVFSFVHDKPAVKDLFNKIDRISTFIFHTTTLPPLKEEIQKQAERKGIPAFDLTGPASRFMEEASGMTYKPDLSTLHQLDKEYDKRISALSYTVEHDDGLGQTQWNQADIFILGVSRTSKTPTSIYLANRGFKVANFALVKDGPIPELIKSVPRRKMVGLTINPEKLQAIRLKRAAQEGIPGSGYTSLEPIRDELQQAHHLFFELDIPIIDVTHHAVEETAALILKELKLR